MSEVLKSDLKITYCLTDQLIPFSGNPRTHTKKQIQQIARSIQEFGFTNPILLNDKNGVIAGHGRLEAAKSLGMGQVPTICLSRMSHAQKRAYIIADNKLAENAGWDNDLLKIELSYLSSLEIDFDISLLGFEMPEIDIILSDEQDVEANEPLVPTPPLNPVSRLGDVWAIGQHKILCGDALDRDSYHRLLGPVRADLIFIDPPYNVPIEGHVCGAGKIHHTEFAMASGEMSSAEFGEFLEKTFQNLIDYSKDGSIHYVCMDWRHMAEVISAGKIYTDLKNLCVWNKTNGGMGSLYRSKHELIFVFKNGTAPHTNNIQLGTYGRYRTNVWDYAGVNTFKEDRMDELTMHPTVKPLNLVADAILDCSNRNDLVLDAFGGSGTTLLAAEKTGRKARLIELDPKYVDVTIQRFKELYGVEAVHAEEQKTFSVMKKIRQVGNG